MAIFRRQIVQAGLTMLGLVVGGCSPAKSVKAAVKAEQDRKPAPEFSLKDSNGRVVKLSEYKGKVGMTYKFRVLAKSAAGTSTSTATKITI